MASLSLFCEQPRYGTFVVAGKEWRSSPVFETYWRFAAERQEIFFRRLKGDPAPTQDPILSTFKFTNAYRASDRVSQYLIREVIYGGCQDREQLFFRTILFKLFNKIETWKLLAGTFGELAWRHTSLADIAVVLTDALNCGTKIYSSAYIMPSGGGRFPRKHDAHLFLLQEMMDDCVPAQIGRLKTMEDAFCLLRSFPMVGNFLAYQFVTDLNYSSLCSFSESEFVMAGPGARDGIRKCFPDLPMALAEEAIKSVCREQKQGFERGGLDFRTLWGRPLQFIDCQNLFCEVDKYSRVAHPEIGGLSDRTRIKQRYRSSGRLPTPFYPPKWNLPATNCL